MSHPIQYQAPLYRRLHERGRVVPNVVFCSRHGIGESYDPGFGRPLAYDVPLLEGYCHSFVTNWSPVRNIEAPLGLCNPALLVLTQRRTFDILLVHGWGHVSEWLAYAGAAMHRLPYMVRGEARPEMCGAGSSALRRGRTLLLRRLVRGASACLAIGTENRRFYEGLDVDPLRIYRAPYAVDNDRFLTGAKRGHEQRSEVLLGLGLDPGIPTILFAGKLQPRKRPGDLVQAFLRMRHRANLLVIGDGPLASELRLLTASSPHARLIGFVNQAEIPIWYGVADVFVMPSEHEPWGLGINEAMAAGAVPVASEAVGAVPDLVTPSTGRTFRVGDIDQLQGILDDIVQDDSLLAYLREGGREVLREFTLDEAARGIEDATLAAWEG